MFCFLCSVHDVVYKYLARAGISFKHIYEQRMGKGPLSAAAAAAVVVVVVEVEYNGTCV